MIAAGRLSIDTHDHQSVKVVELRGEVRLGKEGNLLRAELKRMLDERTALVLILRGVTVLDSSGIGVLVEAKAHAISAGIPMKLAELPLHASRLVHQLKLETILDVHATEADALAGFAGAN